MSALPYIVGALVFVAGWRLFVSPRPARDTWMGERTRVRMGAAQAERELHDIDRTTFKIMCDYMKDYEQKQKKDES